MQDDRAGSLAFAHDGAQRLDGVVDMSAVRELSSLLGDVPVRRPGLRLFGLDGLCSILSATGGVGALAGAVLGPECRPVRALLFNKTPATNWALAWHQDRTIAVAERVVQPGFGPWSVKDGIVHVAPPFALLAEMITLRVHLDPVPMTNAPLLIAPGSHRYGRVPERQVRRVVEQCGAVACCARAGDVWLYATPILHASEAAAEPARRRVLHVDYAARALPGGLRWLGI